MNIGRIFPPPLVLLVMAGVSQSASAFQPLITDDTGTQGARGNQLEFSWNHDRSNSAGQIERVDSVPMVYTRGLSETIDVFGGIGFSRIRTDSSTDVHGYGNSSLGVKWRFYENEESGSSLAIKPEVIFPVSGYREASGLGTGKLSGNLTFIFSQEVPFGAIHVNAGVGKDRYKDSLANPDATIKRFSIAPVWDVSEQWTLAMDLGEERSRAAGSTTRSRFWELGAIYTPDKNIDLALGVVRMRNSGNPGSTTHTATAGVTWRFQ